MHSLETIQTRNADQVRQEFLDAVERHDYEKWVEILRANPDMRKELRRLL